MMPLCECEFEIDHHTGDDVPYVSRRVCEVEFITCQARLVLRVYGLSSFSEKK